MRKNCNRSDVGRFFFCLGRRAEKTLVDAERRSRAQRERRSVRDCALLRKKVAVVVVEVAKEKVWRVVKRCAVVMVVGKVVEEGKVKPVEPGLSDGQRKV